MKEARKQNHLRRLALNLVIKLIGILCEAISVSLALYKILELVRPVPQVGTVRGTVSLEGMDVSGITMKISRVLIDGTVDPIPAGTTLTDAAGTYAFVDELAIGPYDLDGVKDTPEGTLHLKAGAVAVTVVSGENVLADLPLEKSMRSDKGHRHRFFHFFH